MSLIVPVLIGAAVGVAAAEYRSRRARAPRRNPLEKGSRSAWSVQFSNQIDAIFLVWHVYPEAATKKTEDALAALGEYVAKRGLLRLELPYDSKGKPDFTWLFPQNREAFKRWVRNNQRENQDAYRPFLLARDFSIIQDPMLRLPQMVAALLEVNQNDPLVDEVIDGWLDQDLRTIWSSGKIRPNVGLKPAKMMELAATFVTREQFLAALGRLYMLRAAKSECSPYNRDIGQALRKESKSPNKANFVETMQQLLASIPRDCRSRWFEHLPYMLENPADDRVITDVRDVWYHFFDSFFSDFDGDELAKARREILAEIPEITLKRSRELLMVRSNPTKDSRHQASSSRPGARRNPVNLRTRRPVFVHRDNQQVVLYAAWLPSGKSSARTTEDVIASLAKYIEKRGMLRLELPYDSKGRPDFTYLFPKNTRTLSKWFFAKPQSEDFDSDPYGPFLESGEFNIMNQPMYTLHRMAAALMELSEDDSVVGQTVDSWLEEHLRGAWSAMRVPPEVMLQIAAFSLSRPRFLSLIAKVFDFKSKTSLGIAKCRPQFDEIAAALRSESRSPSSNFVAKLEKIATNPAKDCQQLRADIFAETIDSPLGENHDRLRAFFRDMIDVDEEDIFELQKMIAANVQPSLKHSREMLFA